MDQAAPPRLGLLGFAAATKLCLLPRAGGLVTGGTLVAGAAGETATLLCSKRLCTWGNLSLRKAAKVKKALARARTKPARARVLATSAVAAGPSRSPSHSGKSRKTGESVRGAQSGSQVVTIGILETRHGGPVAAAMA